MGLNQAAASLPARESSNRGSSRGDKALGVGNVQDDNDAVKSRYIPPFEVIKRQLEISPDGGRLVVTATYDDLIKIIQLLMSTLDVDEAWYLAQYGDVADAVSGGVIPSAKQHFIDNGYFEGRLPFSVTVDERWYQKEYPDVADSIRIGTEASAQAHFIRTGYKEGRLPCPS
jgi:hypothetical protein